MYDTMLMDANSLSEVQLMAFKLFKFYLFLHNKGTSDRKFGTDLIHKTIDFPLGTRPASSAAELKWMRLKTDFGVPFNIFYYVIYCGMKAIFKIMELRYRTYEKMVDMVLRSSTCCG